mgnify:CR=1 FL=1
MVVRNDGGGTKRVWKPATRSTATPPTRTGEPPQHGFDRAALAHLDGRVGGRGPGSGFPGLGASKGR